MSGKTRKTNNKKKGNRVGNMKKSSVIRFIVEVAENVYREAMATGLKEKWGEEVFNREYSSIDTLDDSGDFLEAMKNLSEEDINVSIDD